MTRPRWIPWSVASALCLAAAFPRVETFADVQRAFRERVTALSRRDDVSIDGVEALVAEAARATFGAHPDLVRREAEARLAALPVLAEEDLADWSVPADWDALPALPPGVEGAWLAVGWDPERVAALAKNMLLSRQLGASAFGRRALFDSYCPAELVLLAAGPEPEVGLVSLGELFALRLAWTEAGVWRPVAVQWRRERE